MKKLKYILFSTIMCFLYINNVNASATCVYETSYTAPYKYSITCISNPNGNANCTIKDSYNQLSIATGAVSFKIENSCPSTIYTSSINNEITNINISSGDPLSLNKNKSTEGNVQPNVPTEPTEPSTNNEYENDSRYIQAKADADKYCNPQNFEYQDDAKCEEARNKMNEVKALYEDSGGDFDPERFCKGPVQGVFTTLGWVFFVVKIIIPIMLIIFGSIDVGKAVIASKDDEIKKSVKTLAIRAIAGIIIFFVPTILGFAVKMIDNNDIYKGTFWDCTKCMLDPVGNVCSGLRGEE